MFHKSAKRFETAWKRGIGKRLACSGEGKMDRNG